MSRKPDALKAAFAPDPPFDVGSSDGYSDALRSHPCDPSQRFQSWHRSRPVADFAEYERGYRASFKQVAKETA